LRRAGIAAADAGAAEMIPRGEKSRELAVDAVAVTAGDQTEIVFASKLRKARGERRAVAWDCAWCN